MDEASDEDAAFTPALLLSCESLLLGVGTLFIRMLTRPPPPPPLGAWWCGGGCCWCVTCAVTPPLPQLLPLLRVREPPVVPSINCVNAATPRPTCDVVENPCAGVSVVLVRGATAQNLDPA